MFKKVVNLSLISLFSLTMSACGNTTVEQTPQHKAEASHATKSTEDVQTKDVASKVTNKEAENVIKRFEATQSSVTYKDPSSFQTGDKYLTPDFAKKYHGQIRAGMEQFIKSSKGIVTGKAPKITFSKQNGNHLIYHFDVVRTISIEQPKPSSIASHVNYLVTVTKQKDGSYLISDMVEAH